MDSRYCSRQFHRHFGRPTLDTERLTRFLAPLLLSSSLLAASPERPDPKLTPGEVFNVTKERVCSPRYATNARHVTREMKRATFRRYHVKYFPHAYQVDHLIPLCLGGRNSLENLWPEPIDRALESDKVERRLCHEVCAGEISLEEARRKVLKQKGAGTSYR